MSPVNSGTGKISLPFSSTAHTTFVVESREIMNMHIVFSANNCPAHTLFAVQYTTISTRNNTRRPLAGAYRLPNPNANNRGSIAISFPSWGKNLSGMKEWGSGYISGSRLIALLHSKLGRELSFERREEITYNRLAIIVAPRGIWYPEGALNELDQGRKASKKKRKSTFIFVIIHESMRDSQRTLYVPAK